MCMGAGRVIHQNLARINQCIADQSFFENRTMVNTMLKVWLISKVRFI